MFGNTYFGTNYYADTYWGPLESKPGATTGAKPKKKWTEEELKGLEDYGKARMGIELEEVATETFESPEILENQDILESAEILEETIIPDSQEIVILPESQVSPTLQEQLAFEEDIGLILAIITAHET